MEMFIYQWMNQESIPPPRYDRNQSSIVDSIGSSGMNNLIATILPLLDCTKHTVCEQDSDVIAA